MPKTPLEKILPRPWLCTIWIRHFEGLSTGNRRWSWIYPPNIPGRLYIWKAECWLSLQCSSRADCCAWCVMWDLFLLKDCTQQTRDVPVPWGICKRWRLASKILTIIILYGKCDGAEANYELASNLSILLWTVKTDICRSSNPLRWNLWLKCPISKQNFKFQSAVQ